MRRDVRELLLKHVSSETTEEEAMRVRRLLDGSEEARRELRSIESTARLLRNAAQEGFAPGFAERVMQAVGADGEASVVPAAPTLADSMVPFFTRLAPAALATAAAIATLNVLRAGDFDPGSLASTALGLPPVTIESSLGLAAMAEYAGELDIREVRE